MDYTLRELVAASETNHQFAVNAKELLEMDRIKLKCSNPYMRDNRTAKVHAMNGAEIHHINLSPEERLAITPFRCGQCISCRLAKAREWQLRILLEAHTHQDNIFVGLTYRDEELSLTDDGVQNLNPHEATKWLKRFRKHYKKPFRYLLVGEYGDLSLRPHYHAILFGVPRLEHALIRRTWGMGHISTDPVNAKTAAYISGYSIKKLTSDKDERLSPQQNPEFMRSSRKNGGLGIRYIEQFAKKLKKNQYVDNWETIQKPFKFKGKNWSIGRYLGTKLMDFLEIPCDKRSEKLFEYQNQLFIQHLYDGDNMQKSIIEESDEIIDRNERMVKLHHERRKRRQLA